jgi:integrase
MDELTNGKKHTPHDCRHTFSWLCDKYKVDDMSKHLIMGHSLGRDVEKSVYGHRTTEELNEEIQKIQVPFVTNVLLTNQN